jgi:hypothetical protein
VGVEILLWLAPAGVVTVLAMAWAGWRGHHLRRELDRDEAVRRLGAALERPGASYDGAPRRPRERSTSVALRHPPGSR